MPTEIGRPASPVGSGDDAGASIRLPAWLGGNNILGFANLAGLHLSPIDVTNGLWSVQTVERFEDRPAGLVSTTPLIRTDGASTVGMARLRALPSTSQYIPIDVDRLQAEFNRIVSRRPGDFAAFAAASSFVTATGPDSQLEALTTNVHGQLLSEPGGEPFLQTAEAHLVEVSPALSNRYHLTRLLTLLHDDPSLFSNPPVPAPGELAISPARFLFSDTTLGLNAYFDPLVTARSPWVWAFTAPRVGALIVYSFGAAVSGRRGEAAELLQLQLPAGGMQSGPRPTDINEEVCRVTLGWWVEKLDMLFSHLTEPANFCDDTGSYLPLRHLQVLLGVEQLFRHVQSILAHDRDRNARRVLLFSALDTLEGLGLCGTEQSATLSHAHTVLDQLSNNIPVEARPILLPNAKRAVEGLAEVQDGFYLRSRVNSSTIRLGAAGGANQEFSKEQAAQMWLRVLRNANHGFRPEPGRNVARTESLLMAHDGTIPDGLSHLAYLYLLELLALPSAIDRVTRRAVR